MTDQSEQGFNPIRVLLVEDALDQALLVRAMLGGGLYDVTHAQDGMHAVEIFQTGGFDVVITDLNLPGMDGFDVTRELKRRRPDIPVLAVTGYTSPGYTDSAYRAGVDAILRKPPDQKELLAQLRELLPGRHPAPERPANIFVLATRPGDATLGCGGAIAFHREQGHDVLIFVFNADEGLEGRTREAARKAAERLGARIILSDPAGRDEEAVEAELERHLLLSRVVRELDPDVAYIPTHNDHDVHRKNVSRLGRTILSDSRTILAYWTPTSTLDFRPSHFRRIDDYMSLKLEALEAFYGGAEPPRELSGRFAQAAARYWGRLKEFSEIEPFEVVKGDGQK